MQKKTWKRCSLIYLLGTMQNWSENLPTLNFCPLKLNFILFTLNLTQNPSGKPRKTKIEPNNV